ncbi:MAG: alcohol dehydrogenase [Gammaproteobacteria bacterium]|nr:MAG: alcohol dehydrogenase [Gammaproteobacteria bacterium]
MKALVVDGVNEYSVQEVAYSEPKMGEVLIKMKATGVCHSDLSIINGTIPMAAPVVVGHEGAGIVESVGEGVSNVKPGDHVALTWVPICGECFFCQHQEPHLCTAGSAAMGKQLDGTSRIFRGDTPINVMTLLGAMAEYAVVPSISLVKIEDDIPFPVAAMVGCGVMTGVGAAIKTAEVKPGSTVAVFGCGGVGLSVIQGARLAGAKTIIAVDLSQNKVDLALEFGATHGITSKDPLDDIKKITHGIGVDYSFEVVGIPALVTIADMSTRRGGVVTVVGVGKLTEFVSINSMMFSLSAKTYKGCFYGNANPAVDFPNLLSLYRQKRLPLDEMITKTYDIDDAPQAFDDMQAGLNARGIIVYD